ncbi:hypothetical protein LOB94_03625 [Lactobacillus delbrueckii subsp. bulgaricus]|uniref:hypothetical protein n=1 Tax=Lactobacillus delbrueckii TaxID=1584 RepID=UPI0004A5C714|nr:hypothetical protein [Lactobacillus delbrueckii]MCD5464875.1 hypothetical protein [Lactobacillus delbrueckii subsp. bulgaricus]MCD5482388.1 hypothetical protein [Lactobacillus delbrueckii subsp. bulgaricus]MCD5482440.1 hypothetical protein [Lactobacillus delbrueckii subsp. bulgaricus]MCT3468539.1 hypothetical protein [Lactobacillus delbrueckii subsp. bulgaricus]CDR75478.1 Protein of unknown function [Lactobacillus delbrueckii subsp. bulgaricus]
MKNSEFIERFNDLDKIYDIRATKDIVFSHGVEVNEFEDNNYKTVARLPEDEKDWSFFGAFQCSPQMLELMAELAKTPPEEREDVQKYVILNGLPRHGTCHYFLIDVYSCRLLPCQLDGLDESDVAAMGAYSKDGLREAKKALTPELATAVDMMKVTFERAIELTENSRHDDLD